MRRTKASPAAVKEGDDSVETVFRTFLGTSGLLREKMRDYFGRYGISGSQWGVLRALHREEAAGHAGLRLTDIGDRLLITPPSVTGVVNRLEKLGWVARKASPGDGRAKLVVLTPAGRAMFAKIIEGHRARVHKVMAGLSGEELHALHELLKQLGQHLETIGPETL